MGKNKFFENFKPLLQLMPTVAGPENKPPFRDRAAWTIMALIIFLCAQNIPLYGIPFEKKNKTDPFYWMRTLLASNRGTLMELGISPIITSNMVMQILSGSQLLHYDSKDKGHRILFEAAQKLLGFCVCICMAVAYLWSGVYGEVDELGPTNFAFIVGQLTFASAMVLLLDETLKVGWGLGSGIDLFIAVNTCETVLWSAMAFSTVETARGKEYEGAIPAFFHMIFWSRPDKFTALMDVLYRRDAPNLSSCFGTVIVFAMVIHLQGYRIDLAVKHTKVRGTTGNYPIKLFYTGNMPVILQSALIANIYFFSQTLYRKSRDNIFVSLLGKWQQIDHSGRSIPVGGLAYYLSPPTTIWGMLTDPIHVVFYLIFIVLLSGFLSYKWLDVSGSSARDVARQLREQSLVFPGYRDNQSFAVLNRYIPYAAVIGGVVVALISIIADILGAIGGGTGILLAVNIIYGYFETVMKESDSLQREAAGFKFQ